MKAIDGTMLGAALLLAGCGGAKSADPGGVGKTWAIDACKTFPGDAASKAVGLTVVSAQDSPGASVGETHVSTCSYTAANGKLFTVALRQDGSGSGTMGEAVAGLTAKPDMTGPVSEIPVGKGRAFWLPRLKTLTYLPDDARMITVTPPGRGGHVSDSDVALKVQGLAIAEAAAKAP